MFVFPKGLLWGGGPGGGGGGGDKGSVWIFTVLALGILALGFFFSLALSDFFGTFCFFGF